MGRRKIVAAGVAAVLTTSVALPAHAQPAPAQPDIIVAAQADTDTGSDDADDKRSWAEESSMWAQGARWIANDLSSDFPYSIVRWITAAASVPLVYFFIQYLGYWNKRNNELAAGIGR